MQKIENAINELISQKTLSLEGIEIVKKIKDESDVLSRENISLQQKTNDLSNDLTKIKTENEQLTKSLLQVKEKYDALSLRESKIKELELISKFQTERGNEIKELFMAVVKNPIIRKNSYNPSPAEVVVDGYDSTTGHCVSMKGTIKQYSKEETTVEE